MAVAQGAAAILAKFEEVSTYRWSCTDPSLQFAVENPATGKTITKIQAGNTETTNAAIEASQAAYIAWKARAPNERCGVLMRASDEIQKNLQELALLLCLENGKPFKDAIIDIFFLIQVFKYFGSIADKLPSEFFDQGSIYSAIIYEPLGSVPSGRRSDRSWTGTRGSPSSCQPPLVKMVSFTGSSAVGAKVASAAGSTLTTTALELGGKNAFVVFEDANLDVVVRDAIEGAYFNKGEACTASSRLLVHKDIYPQFVEKMTAAVLKLKAGDGIDDTTHVGPVVSRERKQQVLEAIELAKSQGARLAAQGTVSTDAHLADGFFVPPTLFADVTPDMAVAVEEIFGPVACVSSFETEDEAVEIINASRYGLFAGVYSTEFSRAMRVARRIEAGVVLVNNYYRGVLGTPFGGAKDSGHGREHWIGTLREWSSIKNIRYPSGMGAPLPQWRVIADVL
ncbi:hypothetical protein N7526_011147 [Penicillium atrosanguineum]|nr:hypothetical protein N7526_011400 [Penicillium atrosanguineum]KAJ5118124.1 hypothetical protein N7526_011147 [Penicillium atrosanguineum]